MLLINEKKPHLTFGVIFRRCLVKRVGFRTNKISGVEAGESPRHVP